MKIRRLVLAVLGCAVMTAAAPGVRVEAGSPMRPRAAEVTSAVWRVRTFDLPLAATHIALYWQGNPDAEVAVADSRDRRSFGRLEAVELDEVGEQRGNGETYGSVIRVERATAVRVTTDRPLPRLTVLALDAGNGSSGTAWSLGATATAAVAQPTVISRAGWGADESLRFDGNGQEKWAPAFYAVQKLIVHHTAGKNADPDPAATVRAIYYYHAITQGWGDIGYNFLIDESGRIYEGRYSREYAQGESPTGEDTGGKGVTGAHAQGYNSGTVGTALLGTLTNQDATPAARDALERLLAWKADAQGIDPHGSSLYTNPVSGTQKTFANIAGHRDVVATECPGGTFYGTFPALRSAVAARISGSTAPAASPPAAPVLSATSATSGKGVALSWTVPSDGGSPITGYRIYRSTSSGQGPLLATVGTVTSYRDTATRRGKRYYYTVSAVNSVAEGLRSNEATAVAR